MTNKQLLFAVLVLIFAPFAGSSPAMAQFDTEVILEGGSSQEMLDLLSNRATIVVRAINRARAQNRPITLPSELTAGDDGFGLSELQELATATDLRSEMFQIYTDLLELHDHLFEVRRIFVMVTDSVFTREQELVLTFDRRGTLRGARFAMEHHNYHRIIAQGRELEDDYFRRQIIYYLELFRTAYNRKDVDYIEQQFSDDALIITGTRVERTDRPGAAELDRREVGEENYVLMRQSKEQYIHRLRNHIFRSNAFINVEFHQINIIQHERYDRLYGVNLKQEWTSSNYSDTGYLFLIIDYEDESQPLIYVRAWQPEPFEDGRLIDFSMFDIVK